MRVTARTASTKRVRTWAEGGVPSDLDQADAKVAGDFKAVWDQFKATREKEIIPAIYKGNADDAKKIADGVQYQRFSKMWRIMSCK